MPREERECDTLLNHTQTYHIIQGKCLIHLRYIFNPLSLKHDYYHVLKHYREARSFSREKLSAATGILPGMIMGYESRILNLHYDHAKVIANALNIDCSLSMDEYKNFCKPGYGKRIKTIRSQYGISQQEFADMIGCLRSTESI